MDASKLVDSLTRIERKEVFYELARRLFPNTKIEGVVTPLIPWLRDKASSHNISLRLFEKLYVSDFICIEEVSKERFTKVKGLGNAAWREFIRLRGY